MLLGGCYWVGCMLRQPARTAGAAAIVQCLLPSVPIVHLTVQAPPEGTKQQATAALMPQPARRRIRLPSAQRAPHSCSASCACRSGPLVLCLALVYLLFGHYKPVATDTRCLQGGTGPTDVRTHWIAFTNPELRPW